MTVGDVVGKAVYVMCKQCFLEFWEDHGAFCKVDIKVCPKRKTFIKELLKECKDL